jgi:putative cardiolipin synthase
MTTTLPGWTTRWRLSRQHTRVVSDDPAKRLGPTTGDALMLNQLRRALGEPMQRLDLVSPYFVPTASGVAWFAALARRGVEMRVLTNSLEATDVVAVHAGYAKRRRALLREGVSLYELRRSLAETGRPKRGKGSSRASLHAKTFSVDRARVFVGSFNFDPRSARLNTEIGFVIESPALAQAVDDVFRTRVPLDAYAVQNQAGRLSWTEGVGVGARRYESEPGTSFWLRGCVALLSALPIEWLL